DFSTSTTHKTLRGPRGGLILMKSEHEKAINSAVFPGIQGGPLMHVIAAKAAAFGEAMTRDFMIYQERVLENARVLAKVLQELGHLMADVLDAPADEAVLTHVRNAVGALTRRFPVYR